VDCYSQLVRFQFVNSYDNTHKGGVQWAIGLEIGRHINAHSEYVVSCLSGKIQTVL
jgi:formylmethanofuran dehydrogenase subunit A